MTLHATLIPGDGIGPSITDATVRLLKAAGADITWDIQLAGMAAVTKYNDPIPEATLASIRKTKLALKGPLETPVGEGFRSINVALRKEFDLYANVRPAKSVVPGLRFKDVDIVIVRENTEGLYIGVENYVKIAGDPHAAAQSMAVITRYGSERIVRYAFEYALANGRKRVTLVHKANILKFSQGLFLETGRTVAKQYRNVVARTIILAAQRLGANRIRVGHIPSVPLCLTNNVGRIRPSLPDTALRDCRRHGIVELLSERRPPRGLDPRQ